MPAVSARPAARPSPLCLLAARAQRGEQPALERLLASLSERLPSLVFRELGLRGYHLADADVQDLAQDVLILVWQRDLGRFDSERGGFLSFVRGRVRWAVADAVRKKTRQAHVSLEDRQEEGYELEAEGARPDETQERAERELKLLVLPKLVKETLACDESARLAVMGNDLERRTLAEVATDLGVHISNACRARKRGLALLQQRLPQELRVAA